MPCYNCASTLESAFDSIQGQHFDFPYEVVMVDDGSTDATPELIRSLSKKHPHVRHFTHPANKGGGAARNTGIKESSGDFIFCLDSDNILAPDTLPKMVRFLQEKKADGAAFYERRFFTPKHGTGKFKSHFNAMLGRPIVFEDIWNGSNMLLDNFIYTRASYVRSGGYPTDHGFDTQAYEMSYLGAGGTVLVCPETVFYHQQAMKNRSYFERVYENGEFSLNYYLAMENVIGLFSAGTIGHIIRYDVFGKASLSGDNIKKSLDSLHKKDPEAFFSHERDGTDALQYVQAVRSYKIGDYAKALAHFQRTLDAGYASPLVCFNILRTHLGLAGMAPESITKEALALLGSSGLRKQNRVFSKRSLASRIASRLRTLYNKFT